MPMTAPIQRNVSSGRNDRLVKPALAGAFARR
jgi:hypothetical protein